MSAGTFNVVARPKCPGLWVNLYRTRDGELLVGGGYRTRRAADDVAKPYRLDCVFMPVEPSHLSRPKKPGKGCTHGNRDAHA
jgi:hypothetical protein